MNTEDLTKFFEYCAPAAGMILPLEAAGNLEWYQAEMRLNCQFAGDNWAVWVIQAHELVFAEGRCLRDASIDLFGKLGAV